MGYITCDIDHLELIQLTKHENVHSWAINKKNVHTWCSMAVQIDLFHNNFSPSGKHPNTVNELMSYNNQLPVV